VPIERPRTFDLLALGEAIVDFISKQIVSSLKDAAGFERFVGGEVTNVAFNLSRLGGRSAVVGCVGDDGLGRYVQGQLERAGVNTDHLRITSQAPTTLSIVSRQTATPDFIIYRGADSQISLQNNLCQAVKKARAVHTSAFALSREPARSTILHLLQTARENDCLISLDPNYHPRIWPDLGDFSSVLKRAFKFVDVTKPSIEDCTRIFGPGLSPEEYAGRFLDCGAGAVALTMGSQGVLLLTADGAHHRITPNDIEVADVTGAGDAFWSGLLMALLDGYSIFQAVTFGQRVAEIKISAVGPLSDSFDRFALYANLGM